jgi:hypothetical protein
VEVVAVHIMVLRVLEAIMVAVAEDIITLVLRPMEVKA